MHIFPVSISTHGIALNITVQSYRDQLDFGFIAGANIIPHVQVLCDMLPLEFDALEAAFAPPPDVRAARPGEREYTMIEMPPLQFAEISSIRMSWLRGRTTDRQTAGRALPWLAGDGVFLAPTRSRPRRSRHPGNRAGSARLWRDRPAGAGRGL